MRINIKATGIELTPAISQYVEKKISALGKYVRNADAIAQVEVGRSTQHHKTGEVFMAEVHLTGAGLDLYAVSEHSDLYAAIDLVKDEIARSAVQQKGRREALHRRGARAIKNMIRGLNPFRRKQ